MSEVSYKRTQDETIEKRLKMAGAVVIEGLNGGVKQQLQNSMLKVFYSYRILTIDRTID